LDELAIATPVTPMGAQERVLAPHDLTDEEVVIWVATVNAEPADWFSPSTMPLLTQYCRHTVEARRIAELKDRAYAKKDFATYNQLIAAQARESGALAMLATKMRLAQQSTVSHRGNKRPSTARKLWQD